MIESERTLKPADSRGDIVVGDAVLLELKKGIRSKAERDPMRGQLMDYAHTWPQKPVLLVLFETLASDLQKHPLKADLISLHKMQPLVTVLMPVPQNHRKAA